MAGHTAGEPSECYGIPIILQKDADVDERGNQLFEPDGKPRLRCGFKIGGGIDQDHTRCPRGYPDNGVYVTYIYEGGPAHRCGLQLHDKLLQVNGQDFTVVTHRKAVEYIKRKPVLNMLVYRKGIPQYQQKSQMISQMQYQQSQPSFQSQAPPLMPQQFQTPVGGSMTGGQFRQY